METQIPASRAHSSVYQQVAQAWKRRDYQQAIEILTCASQRQPSDAKLLLNLGEAYGLRYDYAQAERCLEQAVSVSTNRVATLTEAGRRCEGFKQPRMATGYFMRAAERSEVSPCVLVALAEFEESHSRLDRALAFLQRALEVQPNDSSALVARARLHRAAGELEQGERLLRSLLAWPSGEHMAKAWYELGTNLDRQGSYDQAIEALLQAKALVRPCVQEYVLGLRNTHASFRAMEKSLSTAMFERWSCKATELAPARRFAFLCGHPRSGTTLLEHVLDAHPGIVATDETPILFEEAYGRLSQGPSAETEVTEILESASIEALRAARADYFHFTEAFLGEPIGERLLIDKNPAMDVRIPIVARIFPEALFLVAIRDPRDVCLSCFMLPLTEGEVGALYLSLEETAAFYASVMGFSRTVRSIIRSPQMEVRYEDVVRDLESEARRVLSFLGLDWNPEVLRHNDHAKTKLLRCGVDEAVAKPVFKSSVGRWRHYQKFLEPCLEALRPFIKAFGYD